MGLSTHVLDTMAGRPAASIKIELWRLQHDTWAQLNTVRTNADGRVDQPLLDGETMREGEYELRFFVGDYLRNSAHTLTDPPFLDIVPIRFGISDRTAHYHVPLLLSAYGYSTYRGS